MFDENDFTFFKEALKSVAHFIETDFIPSDFEWYLERLETGISNLLIGGRHEN